MGYEISLTDKYDGLPDPFFNRGAIQAKKVSCIVMRQIH